MENIQITEASLRDLALVQRIGRQTFSETFAADNTEENLAKYLEEGFSQERLTAELSNTSSEFYFAVLVNEVIGYLKLNTGQTQTEIKDENTLEIERIYVLKEYHGRKVGQLLYEKAIQVARRRNADYIWLGVWEKNHRALSFYKKNGFIEFDKHIFKLGDEEQTDIMMKLQMEGR
ncbi:GNAT family N-acetyltransferase [Rufibacter immobilis]|uniref:GNAT family N-acetyltransferase n=1 Tax=Rufibacter immobilis TaxID=1348778 RepID=UPI0035E7BF34